MKHLIDIFDGMCPSSLFISSRCRPNLTFNRFVKKYLLNHIFIIHMHIESDDDSLIFKWFRDNSIVLDVYFQRNMFSETIEITTFGKFGINLKP